VADWERRNPGSVAYISSYFHEPITKPAWTTGRLLSVVIMVIGVWRFSLRWMDNADSDWPFVFLATAAIYWTIVKLWPVKGETTILTERARGMAFPGPPEIRRHVRATYLHKPGRAAKSQEVAIGGVALVILLSSLAR
jgi:hypothetical protein